MARKETNGTAVTRRELLDKLNAFRWEVRFYIAVTLGISLRGWIEHRADDVKNAAGCVAKVCGF